MNVTKKYSGVWALTAIMLLALVLRVYHIAYKSISIDEAIGAFYAKESLFRVLIMTINDVHPPLFYLLHHLWIRLFGISEVALRSISVVFALLSVWAIYQLSVTLFNKKTGLVAALLLATSPWHIWISQNGRSNAMLVFLILLSTWFFVLMLRRRQLRWFFWYGLVTWLALLTHYFAFMVWAAQLLLLLLHPSLRRQTGATWWYTQGYIFLAYFIWLPFMVSQFISKTRPMYKTVTPAFVKNLFQYLNPQAAVTDTLWQLAGWIISISLFFWGAWRLRRRPLTSIAPAPSATSRSLRTGLILGYGVTAGIMAFGALYFAPSTTTPLLLRQLAQNPPAIFAASLKSYHVEQLASLQYAFLVVAVLGGLALILFYYIDRFFAAAPQLPTATTAVSMNLFLSLHLALPLLLAGLVSLKSPYLLLRNLVILLPFYILTLAFGIAATARRRRFLLLVPLLFLSALSLADFEEWYKKDDWRGLAHLLQTRCRPGDVILLDHLFGQKPLYYYGVESHRPLRRTEFHDYSDRLQGDLWVVRSYKNDWCVVDSTDRYFKNAGEWSFTGSTNPDDLFPIDGSLKVYHYQRKSKTPAAPAQLADLPGPESPLLPASLTSSMITVSGSSRHKTLFNR